MHRVPNHLILSSFKEAAQRENQISILQPRDLKVFKYPEWRRFLSGRTTIEALINELPQTGEWIIRYRTDRTGKLLTLFPMHRASVALLRTNSYILWMDYTYETNLIGV